MENDLGSQFHPLSATLRKHAYSNILKIVQQKKENSDRKLIFFVFLLKTQIVGTL